MNLTLSRAVQMILALSSGVMGVTLAQEQVAAPTVAATPPTADETTTNAQQATGGAWVL